MKAETRTLQDVLHGDRQFVVPVYQLPYVWELEKQWEPLWNDIESTAVRLAEARNDGHNKKLEASVADQSAPPYLLGAIVIEYRHIQSDSSGGSPVVPNGIAMCKIHHAAFDSLFLGIDPDYKIEIRGDILLEQDGPTLKYALQALHSRRIALPRSKSARPDPDRLSKRFDLFKAAI